MITLLYKELQTPNSLDLSGSSPDLSPADQKTEIIRQSRRQVQTKEETKR